MNTFELTGSDYILILAQKNYRINRLKEHKMIVR